jgi:hypothetical protein
MSGEGAALAAGTTRTAAVAKSEVASRIVINFMADTFGPSGRATEANDRE